MPLRSLIIAVLALAALGCTQAPPRTAARPAPRTIGAMMLTYDADPLTQVRRPSLSTFDDKQNGMLGFWCLENGLAVLVGLSGDAAAGAPPAVAIRYATDSMAAPAAATDWLVQQQRGFRLAYLRPDRVPAFTAEMLKVPEVRIEVANPRNQSVTTYTFSLAGLRAALPLLTCVGAQRRTDHAGRATT